MRDAGGWIINGSKNFITHAIHGDICVAFASSDRSKLDKGITAFVFEKGMKGFSPSKKENKLGLRASETASVVFEDCHVPDENRLGEEGLGFVNAMEILDGGRISIAALAVGIAQGAYESAVTYARERQQFGKAISEFQAIQFKLADMATQIDAARLLMYRVAWMKDQGKKTTKESSMAKLFASKSACVCGKAFSAWRLWLRRLSGERTADSKLCTIGEELSETNGIILRRSAQRLAEVMQTISLRRTPGVPRLEEQMPVDQFSCGDFAAGRRLTSCVTQGIDDLSDERSLIDRLAAGDTRAVARAISKVEDGAQDAAHLMKQVFSLTGRGLVIGITGAPGAGKSSLVDKLALLYRQRDEGVGIIAVDPSSPFSGGAILGDRIRMQTLGLDKGVFIRSMATRGNLGGLARATVDAVAILDAAGFAKIIVETVGVGQDEVEIVKAADVSVVVLVPGMGDDIQAIKAGIMEIGDIFVINKADRDGVFATEKELEALLSLAPREDSWQPPIVKTVATESKGIGELASAIDNFRASRLKTEVGHERRRAIARWRILELVRERLLVRTLDANGASELLDALSAAVAARQRDPYSAAEEIMEYAAKS